MLPASDAGQSPLGRGAIARYLDSTDTPGWTPAVGADSSMGATFRYAWCGTPSRAYRVVRASRALISSVMVSLTLSTGPTWGGVMLNAVKLTCVVATPVTV